MTTAIDLSTTQFLKNGTLPKTGSDYALVFLGPAHIGQILALQDIAFADLSPAEEGFLLKKEGGFFQDHFAHGGAMLGIVADGKLVAQSAIVKPTAQHPKHGMVDMPEIAGVAPEKISVQQNVIVDPAYRGNNLMGVMVVEWLAESQKAGRTEVISEVAVDNVYSWYPYLKNGLHIEGIGVDASDGTKLYNMHGRLPELRADFAVAAEDKRLHVPHADLDGQKDLFAQGYKATGFSAQEAKLVFHAPAQKSCLPQP